MAMRDISRAELDQITINWAPDFADAKGQPFGPQDCLRCSTTGQVVRVVGKDWSAATAVVKTPIGSRFVLTAAQIKKDNWVQDSMAASRWIEREEREDEYAIGGQFVHSRPRHRRV